MVRTGQQPILDLTSTNDLVERYRAALKQAGRTDSSPDAVFELLKLNAIDWKVENGFAEVAAVLPSQKAEDVE